jgi:CHAD domain-containing protein
MPADYFIVSHWKAEVKVLDQNLFVLKDQLKADPIHDLRVAIKKLRSYSKLCSILLNGKDFKTAFENTNHLFSMLGKHRNIQIAKELLSSPPGKSKTIPDSLLIFLELLQEQVAPYCQQAIQRYDRTGMDQLTDQIEKDMLGLTTEDGVAKVKDVLISSFENVEDSLKHFQKKSHLIRKRLKDIYYWLKILPEGYAPPKEEIKTIDKILDHLGRVQDNEVLVNTLKTFRKAILSNTQTEYDLVKEIEATAKKKKESLLKKAHTMTGNLVSEFREKEKAD